MYCEAEFAGVRSRSKFRNQESFSRKSFHPREPTANPSRLKVYHGEKSVFSCSFDGKFARMCRPFETEAGRPIGFN